MFSTVWNTQKFTELGRVERGVREEIQVTWWRKWRVQREREQSKKKGTIILKGNQTLLLFDEMTP